MIPVEVGNNILIAGIGGGFDVYGGIPLFANLPNKAVFFSNYNNKGETTYVESAFSAVMSRPVVVIPRTGVRPMVENYKKIVTENSIDTIILMDGGVDSLMHGDEAGAGTFLEDLVSMVAINQLPVKKILACSGFGTEMEEGVCHYTVLSNIAELIRKNAFYGCSALTKNTAGYDTYKKCCEVAWETGRASHIQSKIISAVEGRFGDDNIYGNVDALVLGKKVDNFISPLMVLYWFFDLELVLQSHKLANLIKNTNTYTDVLMLMRQSIGKTRPQMTIPY